MKTTSTERVRKHRAKKRAAREVYKGKLHHLLDKLAAPIQDRLAKDTKFFVSPGVDGGYVVTFDMGVDTVAFIRAYAEANDVEYHDLMRDLSGAVLKTVLQAQTARNN